MKQANLEERIAALEEKVAVIQAELNGERKKDWRRTVGMFSGNDVMKEIDEEARKIREADRQKARRRKERQR